MDGEEEGKVSTPVTDQAEMGLDQVDGEGRKWRRFRIAGQEFDVNISVLEPYLQVLSHGGEFGMGITQTRRVGVRFKLCRAIFYTVLDKLYE